LAVRETKWLKLGRSPTPTTYPEITTLSMDCRDLLQLLSQKRKRKRRRQLPCRKITFEIICT